MNIAGADIDVANIRGGWLCGSGSQPVGTQTAREQVHELLGDFVRRELARWAVPGASPVDGSGDGEGDKLGIAGVNGAICDALCDKGAHGEVDTALELADAQLAFCGKLCVINHGDAAAEVMRENGGGVGKDVELEADESGARFRG